MKKKNREEKVEVIESYNSSLYNEDFSRELSV